MGVPSFIPIGWPIQGLPLGGLGQSILRSTVYSPNFFSEATGAGASGVGASIDRSPGITNNFSVAEPPTER